MNEKDIFAERERALEDDYFRKKDLELIEKMKQAAAAERARREMGARTGISDPAMLQELQDLGFTPETVVLLPLVPVVQMAWAEGGITERERQLVISLARGRGITPDSLPDRQLALWMARRPDPSVFTHATRLIRAMLTSGGHHDISADDVVKYCETIALASGGFLGIGAISHEERVLLKSVVSELKARD
jgi:hypothetical protein